MNNGIKLDYNFNMSKQAILRKVQLLNYVFETSIYTIS